MTAPGSVLRFKLDENVPTEAAAVLADPPGSHPGILVLRPRAPDRDATLALLARVLPLFGGEPLTGCLWIVDAERVRVRAPRRSE